MPGLKRNLLCGAVLLIRGAACGTLAARQDPGSTLPPKAAESFKIAGTVVDAITGETLARVRVTLATIPPRPQRLEMLTGEGGYFEFAGLPAGKYSLAGARSGYLTATYDEHEQFSTAIVTGPEFATEKLALRLMPMATMAGHVLDEAGEPVRNARVQLFVEDHGQGVTRVLGVRTATTDDRGYFDVNHLQPGSYFVAATARPWYAVYPQGESGPEQISPALDVAYPTTFFGGATDPEGAEAILLKGGERQEIEIRLSPVPALRLHFQEPKTGGLPMPVVRKPLFDSFPVEAQIGEVRSSGNGQFELVGIPAGRYEVTTGSAEQGGQVVNEMNLTRDVQDLSEVRGETLGKLSVALKSPEGEALPAQYGVALRNERMRVMAYQPGDASGKVTFEALKPGKYRIVMVAQGAQGNRYAVVKTNSASRVTRGSEVNVAPGAVVELTAELAVGEARIEGVVKKNGKPMAGVMVALVPDDPEAHVDLFRRDQSDFDGTFTLPGVIPGTYTVVAVEDAWGFDWLKAGVLARYVQHGQKVSVAEKMRGTMHLPEALEVQGR